MAPKAIAHPEWTEIRDRSGLDPLGMQNSSINLYQRLVPGVSNITQRMRYYGLYAWLARIYAEDGTRSTDFEDWKRLVRRAEAVYALCAVSAESEFGMAGTRWASRKLAGSKNRIDFQDNTDPGSSGTPYLQQKMGAFGAAYGSQLFETGVLVAGANHKIPLPSEQLGMPLAAAFADALGDVATLFQKVIGRGYVSRDELERLAPSLPGEIDKKGAERQLYEDLLFAKGATPNVNDLARRDTMLLLLHATRHLEEAPGSNDVRWLFYASMDSESKAFSPRQTGLQQQQARWRIYQANDLLHFGFETLLKFVLDTLADYPAGTTLAELIEECVDTLADSAPFWPENWQEFARKATPTTNAIDESDDSEFGIIQNTWAEGDARAKCSAKLAWRALKLIAIVLNRTAEDTDVIDQALGSLDRDLYHSLSTEGPFFKKLSNMPFAAAVTRILQHRVVNRHLWVARRKFQAQGDYTFLIEVDDGRVRLRNTSGPVFTNPRLLPSLTFLQDIHLIGDKGLTSLGRKLVAAE